MKKKKKHLLSIIIIAFIMTVSICLIQMNKELKKSIIVTEKQEKFVGESNKNSDRSEKDEPPTCTKYYEKALKEFDDEDKASELASILASKYNLKLKQHGTDQIEISISGPMKYRNSEFYVSKVNGSEYKFRKTVKYDRPTIINLSFTKDSEAVHDLMTVTLTSITDHEDPDCKGTIELEGVLEKGSEPVIEKVTVPFSAETQALLRSANAGEQFNCSNSSDKGYCAARNIPNFKGTIEDKSSLINGSNQFSTNSNDTISLKCDASMVSNIGTKAGDSYYLPENTKYYKASAPETINVGKYIYHYAPGSYSATSVSCTRTCTETVKVEYGPPVAIIAGMCIEYKVRVTSYVTCTTGNPPAPKNDGEYCAPTPECVHTSGKVGPQAGPSEDFDECIKQCDGGKYGKSCSRKCYREVYESELMGTGNLYEEVVATRIADHFDGATVAEAQAYVNETAIHHPFHIKGYTYGESSIGYYGAYYWDKSKNIQWLGNSIYTPGRWYSKKERDDGNANKNYKKYKVWGNGAFRLIKKHKNRSIGNIELSDLCNAVCGWVGCRWNQYLNHGDLEADVRKNEQVYQQAIKSCKALSSCHQTTTEIKVYDPTTKSEIFPETDKLNAFDKESQNYVESLTNVLKDKHYTIDANGCYLDNTRANQNAWYKAEGTFGSTWENTKYGTISYKGGGDYNEEHKNQYCLPLSHKDVNEKWWRYYYTKIVEANPSLYSVESDEFKKICESCNWKVHSVDKTDIENLQYNIKAVINKFGYFKWNINIDCFYALGRVCQDSNCNQMGKKVRTVDLKNLFPDRNGDDITAPDETGRTPGFNWSDYANNTKTVNSKTKVRFTNTPSLYTRYVQEKGYSIYSKDYLDYDVYLSKEQIRSIKNNNVKYGTFNGDVSKDAVVHYNSDYLTDTLKLVRGTDIPSNEALKCNNIRSIANGAAIPCEDFEKKE